VRDPDKAALRLIELAIKGGGPDNITCIVADVIDAHSSRVPPTWQPCSPARPPTAARLTCASRPAEFPGDQGHAAEQDRAAAGDAGGATTGAWPAGPAGPAGYQDGYTGTFDTQAFDPSGFGPADGRSDTGPTGSGTPPPSSGPTASPGRTTTGWAGRRRAR